MGVWTVADALEVVKPKPEELLDGSVVLESVVVVVVVVVSVVEDIFMDLMLALVDFLTVVFLVPWGSVRKHLQPAATCLRVKPLTKDCFRGLIRQ